MENYRSIVLTFTATNRPGRYLKLSGLDYGKFLTFEGSEVVEAHILEEINPLSDELSINTLNLTLFNRKGDFSILNPDGVFDVLQHKQKFTVWEDVRENTRSTEIVSHNMGTFYLSDWENTSDTLASFTAVDAIGLLDSAPFNGGVYNTTVGNLVAEVLDGYEYELDAALATESISGYLPIDTRRTALQQIAFAVGAVVDCSRSDKIKIFPAPERSSGLITYQRKFSDGNKVTLKPLITGVSVTSHRYTAGAETEELYKDELVAGTHQITFSSPALADSLAVTGGTLVERGTNYCNVTVTTPGEVVVTGQKYIETTTVLQQTASNLPPNAQDNVLTVTDATLVSPDRAEALAQRILTYYAQRYEQTFRMLAGTEVLADMLIVESFGGEMVRGQLEKMEFDLTGGYRCAGHRAALEPGRRCLHGRNLRRRKEPDLMPWQVPIYDRTETDVKAKADKCYFSAAMLNRIEGNLAYLADLFGVTIQTKTWASTDFLTPSQMQRILANLKTVRDAYNTLPGTPEIPAFPATGYADVNAIEQILWSLRETWERNDNPARKVYTGELYAGQMIGVI